MLITSRTNPTVVAAAALKEKKYRDESRAFLVEGVKLFREAVAAGLVMERVFATEKMTSLCRDILSEGEIITVSDSVLEKISTEKSPQGIICVAKYLDKIHIINKIYKEEDFRTVEKRILILSSLRDPGNLGTVIRSAAAFGCDELILSADCADLYNPKTVRAAMGTLFRQPVTVVGDLPATVRTMTAGGYRVCAAVLDDKAERLDRMTIDKRTAFVVGNEGHGIDPAVVEAAGNTVFIPMRAGVESLNAAAAAAVFLWQSMVSAQ
jgi:TrmH family RNA methyltransferase